MMFRSTHIKIWTNTFSECLSCLHECVVHVHCTFEVFGACVFCVHVGVCVLYVCTVCACARPRSRFYRHTARPREPSWRAEGAAQGRTLHSDQSVLSKYPLLSMCDQMACLCTVGSRWNREFNLIFQKLTSYFQIMHFVWGIFHFPSVFYFPTTSGLSQLLKCPDHNIAAIRKHLHILDRLSSLRRVACNKDDNNRGGYFGFIGMVCFKETIFWSSEAKQWSTLHDDDSIFADSPERKSALCSNWLDWLGFQSESGLLPHTSTASDDFDHSSNMLVKWEVILPGRLQSGCWGLSPLLSIP